MYWGGGGGTRTAASFYSAKLKIILIYGTRFDKLLRYGAFGNIE